uniref:Adhesion molecule with Ig like domain 3 n=1 Tax=Takifugu rubripes TaxID=31033 RepID=A0A3B5K715_TAKRU
MWGSGNKVLLACWIQALLLLRLPLSCVCQEVGGCFWTADILSCNGLGLDLLPVGMPVSGVTLDLSHNRLTQLKRGSFQGLSRLKALNLAHNQLCVIQPGAFQNVSGTRLVHLDLSSNQLQVLERHYFSDLPGLEELLLFNNRIVHVESRALAVLARLRKLYLSHNHITDFPFFSLQQNQPHLSLLDLSSNRLPKLPLQDLADLPLSIQKGLYLHNNSLLCDCSMFQLFRAWKQMGFASMTDFQRDHVCLVYGMQRGAVRFFQHERYFEKCDVSVVTAPTQQDSSVSVKVGQALLLHCATALTGHNLTVAWVSPGQEYVVPPGNAGSLNVYANGSLEIVAARAEDSGTYWCMALDQHQQRNETREVNVTVVVHRHGRHQEHFNTGFTTLLGCIVSLVLVLMYLYLTPCHCPTCPTTAGLTGPTGSQDRTLGCIQTSILSPTPPNTTGGPGHKVSTNKHVVFLEPIKEQQNGSLTAGPTLHNSAHLKTHQK